MIEKIEIRSFTAFDELKIKFARGVNVFIGENSTGKTHILKLLYVFLQSSWGQETTAESSLEHNLLEVFKPTGPLIRLIKKGENEALITINVDGKPVSIKLEKGKQKILPVDTSKIIKDSIIESIAKSEAKAVYIPVKEMLANAPGFRSLYSTRETHFERVYVDIIDMAFLPPLKNIDPKFNHLLKLLAKAMEGKVIAQNEVFYLKTTHGEIEFTLVAEGMRKLALLWLLIRNGSLGEGATLFWDEPETNLNPSMLPLVVEILLELEKVGVQIFIATHCYELLKELELQRRDHSLRFYSLFKDDKGSIQANTSETYEGLSPNKIDDQNARLYDLEIERAIRVENG